MRNESCHWVISLGLPNLSYGHLNQVSMPKLPSPSYPSILRSQSSQSNGNPKPGVHGRLNRSYPLRMQAGGDPLWAVHHPLPTPQTAIKPKWDKLEVEYTEQMSMESTWCTYSMRTRHFWVNTRVNTRYLPSLTFHRYSSYHPTDPLLCSQELESAARRLFSIPDSQKLIMATELRSTGYKRLDIDPKTWPVIKDSVAAVWIRKSLTSKSPTNDIKGSEDTVRIAFNGGAWEFWSFLMSSFFSGKPIMRAWATSPSSSYEFRWTLDYL